MHRPSICLVSGAIMIKLINSYVCALCTMKIWKFLCIFSIRIVRLFFMYIFPHQRQLIYWILACSSDENNTDVYVLVLIPQQNRSSRFTFDKTCNHNFRASLDSILLGCLLGFDTCNSAQSCPDKHIQVHPYNNRCCCQCHNFRSRLDSILFGCLLGCDTCNSTHFRTDNHLHNRPYNNRCSGPYNMWTFHWLGSDMCNIPPRCQYNLLHSPRDNTHYL